MPLIEKYTPKVNKELKERKIRLAIIGLALLVSYSAINNSPEPEIKVPKHTNKLENLDKEKMGDTRSFDLMENFVENKVEAVTWESPKVRNLKLENLLNSQVEGLKQEHRAVLQQKINLLKAKNLNHQINQGIPDIQKLNKDLGDVQTKIILFLRQIFDPSLNFLEAFSGEEEIKRLEEYNYQSTSEKVYVEGRIPEKLILEIRKIDSLIDQTDKEIHQLKNDQKKPNLEEKEKKLKSDIHNLKENLKFEVQRHKVVMINEILPELTKYNQELYEYDNPGEELLNKIYQLLATTVKFMENLLKDELSIEIGLIYVLFLLGRLSSILEKLRGNLFKGLYLKAMFTSGVNNAIHNTFKLLQAFNQVFFEFQQKLLKQNKFPKIKVPKDLAGDSKEMIGLLYQKILDYFDQPKSPDSPTNLSDVVMGDIRYFRNQLLNVKMILQYPIFLAEKGNVEMAWDMIADGDSPFLNDRLNHKEDKQRLDQHISGMSRLVTAQNLQRLRYIAKSIGLDVGEDLSAESNLENFKQEIDVEFSSQLGFEEDLESEQETRYDIGLVSKQIRYFREYGLEVCTSFLLLTKLTKVLTNKAVYQAGEEAQYGEKYVEWDQKLNDNNFVLSKVNQGLPSDIEKTLLDLFEILDHFNIQTHQMVNMYRNQTALFVFDKSTEKHRLAKKLEINQESESHEFINNCFADFYDPNFITFMMHLQPRHMFHKSRGEDLVKTLAKFVLSKEFVNMVEYFKPETDYGSIKDDMQKFILSLSSFKTSKTNLEIEKRKQIYL